MCVKSYDARYRCKIPVIPRPPLPAPAVFITQGMLILLRFVNVVIYKIHVYEYIRIFLQFCFIALFFNIVYLVKYYLSKCYCTCILNLSLLYELIQICVLFINYKF
jgi:hypothetical protein